MEIKNCPRCGRLFTMIKSPICPACEKAEEEDFSNVKEYIDENPMCTLSDVSEGTGVSGKKIMQYIKDGRLEISKGMSGSLRCETCGKPIVSGRFCDKCVIALSHNIKDMFGKNAHAEKEQRAKDSNRMYSSLSRKTL